MASKDAGGEAVKVDVFEDDDEFEEFETQGMFKKSHVKCFRFTLKLRRRVDVVFFHGVYLADWGEQEPEVVQQWEDDWDDDDVNDDFSQQLRAELEKAS